MTEKLINWQPDFLENDIIKIVPLNESDFKKLYKVASDPLIWEQHPATDRYKKEIFQIFFNEAVLSKMAFLIIDKTTNSVIGSTRYYDFKKKSSSIAIGYTFLARENWGGYYNGATKKLLIDYAFKYVNDIYFHIGATNFRSQIAIKKIGGIKTDEIDFGNNGQKSPHFEYLIQKQNWR